MRPHAPVVVAVVVALATGCDQTTKVTDAADKAAKSAQDAAERTTAVVDGASKAIDDAKAATSKAWAGLTDTGELSKTASKWIDENASKDDMLAVVDKGVQVAPVALEVAKTVNAAVDSDTVVEPIYQALGGRDPAEVDKAISSMARVEVIDGLKVGFDELHQTNASVSVDETAYLVTWRHDDHLVGFVYRTRRTIDIEMLIEQTPRLVAMTKAALAEP